MLQKWLIFHGVFYGVLMTFLPQLSVVSLFCVFFSVVPYQLAKVANQFQSKYVVQWRPENILLKHSSCFFSTLEKMKYRTNLAVSSDFCVTGKRMIIYTGNQTFPTVIISGFRMKLYMQHLRRLFCFLLTILSIFNLTLFPAISTKSQISAAPLTTRSK